MTPHLTLLHGWAATGSVWDPLLAHLEMPTQAPDLHCRPNDTLDTWAACIAASLPVGGVLAGWSQGAQLALRIAALHPSRARALILFAGTPRFVNDAGWHGGLPPGVVAQFRQSFATNAERTLQRFLALQVKDDARRAQISAVLAHQLDRSRAEPQGLAKGLGLLAETDLRAALPACPALLVHGAQDALMPLAAARWLHEQMPASELVVLDHAGHVPFLHAPELCADAVRRFLRHA